MKKYVFLFITFIICLGSLIGCQRTEFKASGAETKSTEYNLIVVGGEPEGIAAAVSAARSGLNVLLTEDDSALGGLFTLGRLNFLDMNYGPNKELLTRGIFEQFFKDQGNAFDVNNTKQYFSQLVEKEERITLKLNTRFIKPILEENKIIGVIVQEDGQQKEYRAERIIDATTDADVAAAAGVPYTTGTEDYGLKDRTMGVTLVFRVKGVNWPYVFIYNNWQRLISKIKPSWGDPFAGATWKVAWGYGQHALEYQSHDPLMRYRGPNLARQKDRTVLINALLIFGVDSLNADSRARGIARGKEEIPHILKFMRERFPGFAHVELVDTAEQLYVRETRHIQGEYRLTIDDVLENRDHWDRIAHGSYPVDIQPVGPSDLGNVVGKPAIYSVPFRCLVPLKIDNLLVVGRSASYDSLPHGSVRVVPVGMAAGEAAAAAAAYSISNNLSFRDLSKSKEAISRVQEDLKKQGAYLVEYTPPRPQIMDHWAYSGLQVMRRLGLAAGGYSNNYNLDKEAQYWDLEFLLNSSIQRAEYFNPRVFSQKINISKDYTKKDVLISAAKAIAVKDLSLNESLSLLRDKGVLSADLEERYKNLEQKPTYAELYMVMARVYQVLLKI